MRTLDYRAYGAIAIFDAMAILVEAQKQHPDKWVLLMLFLICATISIVLRRS